MPQEQNDAARKEGSELVKLTEESLSLLQSNLNRLVREYKLDSINLGYEEALQGVDRIRLYLQKCSDELPKKYPPISKSSENAQTP